MSNSTSVAAGNDLFVENMRELWRHDVKLAQALDRIDDDQLPEVEPTKSGDYTLRRESPDGRPIYLHSRYNPVAEARKWCDHNIEDDKFCYIIEGFGLGYHVKELFAELTGDIILAVIEPNLLTLRLAMSHLDFTQEIRSQRLAILADLNKNRLHQQLNAYQSYILMGTKIVTHHPSVQIDKEVHAQMRKLCLSYIEYTKTAIMTLVTNAQTTCRNVANNLPTYLTTPPINELKSRFAGYPAVLVSAGPSLRKNMHQLKNIQDRAVIIAVQSTFKLLLSGNIVPDFVCSLDYHELSRQFYEGVEDFHDVHLVAEPKAHHSVIDAFKGPVSLLFSEFARTCLSHAHDHRDGLRAGASVAHLAFYLAEYLGCDPVILIGQDLAMTDHVYYTPGTATHAAWQAETNRFCSMEMKEWERIARRKPMLRKVKGYDGGDLYTEDLMFNYLEQFEKDFSNTHVKVIDATEGGAAKRGTEVMTLQAAAEQYCKQPIDPALFAYRRRKPWIDPSGLQAGYDQIKTRLTEMSEIQNLCEKAMATLKELEGLVDQPALFNKKIKKVDELRLKVQQYDRAFNIITSGAQLAEFRKFSADQKLKASGAVGIDRAKQQLRRDMEFIRSLREDTDRMVAIVSHAEARLKQALNQDSGMESPIP